MFFFSVSNVPLASHHPKAPSLPFCSQHKGQSKRRKFSCIPNPSPTFAEDFLLLINETRNQPFPEALVPSSSAGASTIKRS